MPPVNGVGEPCAGEPHARFEVAGTGNGADLAKDTGVAQPAGKPAATKAPGPKANEQPRQSPTLQSIWQEMTKYLPPRSLKDVLIDCTPIVIILVIILAFFYLIYRHKDTKEAEFRIFWVLHASPKKRPSNLELRVELAKEYLRSQNQIAPSDEFFRSIESGDS